MMVASFRYDDTGLTLTKDVNGRDSKLLPLWNETAFLKAFLDLSLPFFDNKWWRGCDWWANYEIICSSDVQTKWKNVPKYAV